MLHIHISIRKNYFFFSHTKLYCKSHIVQKYVKNCNELLRVVYEKYDFLPFSSKFIAPHSSLSSVYFFLHLYAITRMNKRHSINNNDEKIHWNFINLHKSVSINLFNLQIAWFAKWRKRFYLILTLLMGLVVRVLATKPFSRPAKVLSIDEVFETSSCLFIV